MKVKLLLVGLLMVFLCISVSASTPFDYVITATGTQNVEDTSVIRPFTWTVDAAGTETTIPSGQGTGGALFQSGAGHRTTVMCVDFEGYFIQTISQPLQSGDKVYLSYAYMFDLRCGGLCSNPSDPPRANIAVSVNLIKPDGQEVILDSYVMSPGTTTPWTYITDKDVSQYFDQTGTYKIKMYQKGAGGNDDSFAKLGAVDEIRLNVLRGTTPIGNVISNGDLATGMSGWEFVKILRSGGCCWTGPTGESSCDYGWYSSGYSESVGSSYTVVNSDSGNAQISASDGEKIIDTFSAIPQSQHGGVVSDISYTVTSNNPDVDVFFSDTRTQTTTNPNANIIAEATPGIKQVSWSNTEQGSSIVSVSDGNKLITSSSLIAPNHDTQWSVADTSAAVETWMIDEKLYAKENPVDTDGDGIVDGADNCPAIANPTQTNTDGDSQGDVCDPDDDNDSVVDGSDNCPLVANSDQADTDSDGIGDACEPPVETCNGIDDDSNGVIDDGISPITTICGIGACGSTGQLSCIGGILVNSCNPAVPSSEQCSGSVVCSDGVDNDCDGLADGADPGCNNNCQSSVPEFPTMLLPATMIAGVLGAVLLIQRTREH